MTELDVPTARPLVAAGALITDDRNRVLLVHPTYKDYWDIPGGYVEPDESPLQACRRELREELSIAPEVRDLLVVDWAPQAGEGDKILFIFDGGILSTTDLSNVKIDGDEISGWSFVDLSDLDNHAPARLTRRIRTAFASRERGCPAYAEHGNEPA